VKQVRNKNQFLCLGLVLDQGGVKIIAGHVKFDLADFDFGCFAVGDRFWQTDIKPEALALPGPRQPEPILANFYIYGAFGHIALLSQ